MRGGVAIQYTRVVNGGGTRQCKSRMSECNDRYEPQMGRVEGGEMESRCGGRDGRGRDLS